MMTDTTTNITNLDDIRAYVFGGRATITIVSAKTGTSFTYHVAWKEGTGNFFFVSLLTGPQNTSDYTPCGTVWKAVDGSWIYRTNQSALDWVRLDSPSQTGFAWFVRQLNSKGAEISNQVEVWISSRCSVCHRKLTAKQSIAAGMGPKCRATVNARLGI